MFLSVFQNKFKDSVVMLSFPKWSLAKIYRNGIFLGKSGTQVPFNERIIGIANKVYFPIQIKPGDKAKIDVELWNNPSQLSIPNGLNAQILPFNKAIKNSMRERQVAYFFMLVIFFIFLYNIFFVYVKYHKGRIMYLFLLLFYLALNLLKKQEYKLSYIALG